MFYKPLQPSLLWCPMCALRRLRRERFACTLVCGMLLRGLQRRFYVSTLGFVFKVVVVCLSLTSVQSASPLEACVDFAKYDVSGGSWPFDVCMDVWTAWGGTIPRVMRRDWFNRELWRGVAEELRRLGTPCLVETQHTSDGAGSSWIRHMAAWIFAEEVGCDWVTPNWTKRPVEDGNGTQLYCHATGTVQEIDFTKPAKELRLMRRCIVANWLAYFHFEAPSVPRPTNGTFEILQVRVAGHDGIPQILTGANMDNGILRSTIVAAGERACTTHNVEVLVSCPHTELPCLSAPQRGTDYCWKRNAEFPNRLVAQHG